MSAYLHTSDESRDTPQAWVDLAFKVTGSAVLSGSVVLLASANIPLAAAAAAIAATATVIDRFARGILDKVLPYERMPVTSRCLNRAVAFLAASAACSLVLPAGLVSEFYVIGSVLMTSLWQEVLGQTDPESSRARIYWTI